MGSSSEKCDDPEEMKLGTKRRRAIIDIAEKEGATQSRSQSSTQETVITDTEDSNIFEQLERDVVMGGATDDIEVEDNGSSTKEREDADNTLRRSPNPELDFILSL